MINATYLDHMGNDLSVVNAARVSFAKQSEWEYFGWGYDEDDFSAAVTEGYTQYKEGPRDSRQYYRLSDKDHRLINFLARERHELPFAHTAITLRCKAPIFVRTHCFKSKIGFVENEVSRRYVSDEPEMFMPEVWRSSVKDKKQGSGGPHPTWNRGVGTGYIDYITDHYENCISLYEHMIKDGVCAEQARMVLPQAMMTEWIWTGSLLAYSRFCKLRLKTDAQAEVRVMAEQVSDIMAGLYPVSWKALEDAR